MGILEEFFDKRDAQIRSQLKETIENRGRVYSEEERKEWLDREIRSLIVDIVYNAEEKTRKIADFFGIDADDLWEEVASKLSNEVDWYRQEIT